ncbi:MAG: translation initiation factor [Candidatus Brocadiae bacterium]|nr:translation initiation factor [Candidatus Brocadiia bacterium]
MGLRIPCLRCGKFDPECACPALPKDPDPVPATAPPAAVKAVRHADPVKMRREKRPGNREIVILEGFAGGEDLAELARVLKQKLGTGGTAKDRTIEIQGDHRDRIAQVLGTYGYRAVKAGG